MYYQKQPNPSTSLSADMNDMDKYINSIVFLQNEIKQKMAQREEQCHFRQMKVHLLNEEFRGFQQMFKAFSVQCKHQWTAVYQELLLIINNIVELYQIKIQKLQNKIEAQQQTISKLTKKNTKDDEKQKLITQGYEGQNEYECRNILQSLEESIIQSNNKKVKISDVIASYQSSVLSSQNIKDQPYQDINPDPDSYTNSNPKHFQHRPIKHHEPIFQTNQQFFKSNKSQNLKSSIQQLSLTQTLKKYNSKSSTKVLNDSIEQKQNHPSFVSSRKLNDFLESKRSYSKSGRSRQGSQACVSKLSQLRKYLHNRSKI